MTDATFSGTSAAAAKQAPEPALLVPGFPGPAIYGAGERPSAVKQPGGATQRGCGVTGRPTL
jgi:hypothetical protein